MNFPICREVPRDRTLDVLWLKRLNICKLQRPFSQHQCCCLAHVVPLSTAAFVVQHSNMLFSVNERGKNAASASSGDAATKIEDVKSPGAFNAGNSSTFSAGAIACFAGQPSLITVHLEVEHHVYEHISDQEDVHAP